MRLHVSVLRRNDIYQVHICSFDHLFWVISVKLDLTNISTLDVSDSVVVNYLPNNERPGRDSSLAQLCLLRDCIYGFLRKSVSLVASLGSCKKHVHFLCL